jgi:hypothetical protein
VLFLGADTDREALQQELGGSEDGLLDFNWLGYPGGLCSIIIIVFCLRNGGKGPSLELDATKKFNFSYNMDLHTLQLIDGRIGVLKIIPTSLLLRRLLQSGTRSSAVPMF